MPQTDPELRKASAFLQNLIRLVTTSVIAIYMILILLEVSYHVGA